MLADNQFHKRLVEQIAKRKSRGLHRSLLRDVATANLVDFQSNDYLGLGRSNSLKADLLESIHEATPSHGSTGSRLISGDRELFHQLEEEIAEFHGAETALLMNSGYLANLAVFGNIPTKRDVVIYDEHVHASIRSGILSSGAKHWSFRHNCIEQLQDKLRLAKEKGFEEVFVAVEALYSMQGDSPDATSYIDLVESYGAHLFVDEAHSLGVIGSEGRGFVCSLGLENRIPVRVVTFGKALGVMGAAILTTKEIRDYLVNFSREFIYTTAMAPMNLWAIKLAYQHLRNARPQRQQLNDAIGCFARHADSESGWRVNPGPIQVLHCPGNEAVIKLEKRLRGSGYLVKAIRSPSVKVGQEMLRISLHSYNIPEEVIGLISSIEEC